MMPYIILLLGIIIVILIVMLGLCIYNRIAFKTDISKTIEHAHAQQEGKLEKQVSLQYDPGNLKVDDDLVYTVSRPSSSRSGARDSARPLSSSRPLKAYAQAEAAYEATTRNDADTERNDSKIASEQKRLEGDESSVNVGQPVFTDEDEGRKEKAFRN